MVRLASGESVGVRVRVMGEVCDVKGLLLVHGDRRVGGLEIGKIKLGMAFGRWR